MRKMLRLGSGLIIMHCACANGKSSMSCFTELLKLSSERGRGPRKSYICKNPIIDNTKHTLIDVRACRVQCICAPINWCWRLAFWSCALLTGCGMTFDILPHPPGLHLLPFTVTSTIFTGYLPKKWEAQSKTEVTANSANWTCVKRNVYDIGLVTFTWFDVHTSRPASMRTGTSNDKKVIIPSVYWENRECAHSVYQALRMAMASPSTMLYDGCGIRARDWAQ